MADEQQDTPPSSSATPTLLLGASLASFMACGVAWAVGLRLFTLTAGSTAASVSAAAMAILIGVATGTLVGRSRPGVRSILVRQGVLALALCLAPLVFLTVRWIDISLWPLVGGGSTGEWLLRLLLALGLVLLPAAAFGSLLAALAETLRDDARDAPQWAGLLFCLAGAGLALGLAAGGIVLVPALGLRGAGFVAMSLGGLGTCATFLAGRMGRSLAGDGGAMAWGPSQGDATAQGSGAGAWGHLAALLVGFSVAAAAIGWGRSVALIAGPTTVNANLALALLLLGIAMGSFVALLVGTATGPGTAAVSLTAAALAVAGSTYLVPWLSEIYLHLAPGWVPAGEGLALSAVVGAVLILPGAILSGLGLAFAAARPRAGDAVRTVLATLVACGIGVVAAMLATPLLLVPAFGLRRTVSLAASVGLLAAVVLLGELPSRWRGARSTAAVALLAVMVVVGGFPASWDPRVVAGGLYRYAGNAPERFGSTDAWLQERLRGDAPLFYREGSEACVVVAKTVLTASGMPDLETLILSIDGRNAASSSMDLRSQVLSGEIPLLLHGPTDKALVIDFMTGVTAGSMLRHSVKSLRVIEREPVVLAAAALFRELANAPLDDGRLTVVRDDPRARLTVDRARYDVIILSGLDPWQSHVGDLVTREGYALLRDRLEEGGLLAQRVSLSASPEGATRAMLRTLARTFPSVVVFQLSADDLLVVGANRPLRMDAAAIRSIVTSNPSVAADIRRVVAVGPNEIFMTLRLGDDALRRLLGDGPINDDDSALVTVAASRDLSVHHGDALVTDIDAAWTGFSSLLRNEGSTQAEKADFLYTLAKSYLGISADPTRALDLAKDLAGMGEIARSRWVTGEARLQQKDLDGAVKEWEAVLALEPENVDALFSLGTFYLDSRDYFAADRYLARAARAQHETPAVLYHYGRNLVQLGKYAQAIDVLHRAREVGAGHESYPLVDYLVGVSDLRLHKNEDAARSLKDYLDWAYQQATLTRVEVDAHLKLADALDASGKRFEALQQRRKAEELRQRIEAYARTQEAAAARTGSAPATGAEGGVPSPAPAPRAAPGPSSTPRPKAADPVHGG